MTVASAIADYFGAVATAYIATATTGGPANWQLQGVEDGRVKCKVDTYTGLGTETAGKVIAMGGVLPNGAMVLGITVTLSTTVSNLTIAIGDYANTTRYFAAAALATQAAIRADLNLGYRVATAANLTAITSDNQILLTTAGATLSAGAILTCIVLYTLD